MKGEGRVWAKGARLIQIPKGFVFGGGELFLVMLNKHTKSLNTINCQLFFITLLLC